MIQRMPNPKILCCASIFALSLMACSQQPPIKTDNLADSKEPSNQLVKLKKGYRAKKLGLKLPDPRSYDNLWDRLFDRFDLPEISHQDIDRELNWFINHPAYIERVQSRAEPFLYSIVKQLEKQHMPGELALLPVIESAFQPHVVSPAHAAGIWQFIPATGRHYGLKQSHSYDGRRDIYASTRAAIKYLKKLHNDFNGDWLLAIAGYNCGEGAVARAIQKNNARGLPTDFWSLDLPQETRSYVPRLLAVAKLFSESEQYGVSLRPIPNQALYKTVKLKDPVDLALAANAADISLDRLFELNPGFKRQQVDLDGSYRLFIPAHKKIADFKQDLARQVAAMGGYDSNAQAGKALAEANAPTQPTTATPVAEPPKAASDPFAENTVPADAPKAAESFAAEATPPADAKPKTQKPAETYSKPSADEPPVAEMFAAGDTATANAKFDRGGRQIGSFANVSFAEPAPQVTEYERAAVANARLSPSKVAQKDRDNGNATDSPKAQEREPAAAASREDRPTARDAHKTSPKGRDEPFERHQEPPESAKKSAYRVQEGDTLYSIARKHDMDVDDLKKLNRLADADEINYGQTLVVPGKEKETGKKTSPAKTAAKSPASTKYTAHEGETLFSISRRFNVTVADLRKWNGIKEDRQFRAGMNITVSGEKD